MQLQPRAQYEALDTARTWYASEEGQQCYKERGAGVEGTLSQGVRAFGLRQTRYRGPEKTHLQHIATAAAINVDRIVAWIEERPRARDPDFTLCGTGSCTRLARWDTIHLNGLLTFSLGLLCAVRDTCFSFYTTEIILVIYI